MLIRSSLFHALSVSFLLGVAAPVVADGLPDTGKSGLVVHLGCGTAERTIQLAEIDGRLIHGLDRDAAAVAAARKLVQAKGLYGRVSISELAGSSLPYVDNAVNLMFVEDQGDISLDEIDRVLAPLGVANIKDQATWTKREKPWPAEIDEWTHYLHDSTNNAVADDTWVGPPKYHQWIAGPKWARSHDHLSTTSAVVSSAGRIFYIVDEGLTASVALDPHWTLIARDAFSGVLLWKRPIELWDGHLRDFRTGPGALARRLVAVGDRVYVTLGYGEPVTALDAATGETFQTYDQSQGTLEVIVSDGVLYLVVGDKVPETIDSEEHSLRREGIWHWWPIYPIDLPARHLVAIEADSGKVLWSKCDDQAAEVLPTTLAVADGRVFFQNYEQLVSLSAKTGEPIWASDRKVARSRPTWSTPTVVVHGDVVISADRAAPETDSGPAEKTSRWVVDSRGGIAPAGEMIAFSTDSGERLWQAPCRECYNAPVDILVADGLVWSGNLVHSRDPGVLSGLDIKTGESRRGRSKDQEHFRIIMSHHRCYRNKATTKYLVLGRDGIELIDVKTGKGHGYNWVRGACQYGVMPCNGLVYSPPHSCACHIETKLDSFLALAPARETSERPNPQPRLIQGPAFDDLASEKNTAVDGTNSSDWPTYRGDISRAGHFAGGPIPVELEKAWTTQLPGQNVKSVTVADGRVFVPCCDTNTVYALSAADGRILWSYTTDGPIDSPPTIHAKAAIFGSADGWIYCLRATDGRLAWKFRAPQQDRCIVAYGRLESLMPVSGSVLIHDGIVHAAAGRTSFLNGGLKLIRLDAATGRLVSETPVEGGLPDVLSCDGVNLFLRHKRFDMGGNSLPPTVPHVYSSAGFLDGNWWHRTYMQFGTRMGSGWGSWPNSGMNVPAGRLLVRNGDNAYAFSRSRYHRDGVHVGLGEMHYLLKAWDTSKPAGQKTPRWKTKIPILARAMVEAEGKLFVAGPPNTLTPVPHDGDHIYTRVPAQQRERQEAALRGEMGGMLQVISTGDGGVLAQYELESPPVWDGMAVTRGKLLVSTVDGAVHCFAGK